MSLIAPISDGELVSSTSSTSETSTTGTSSLGKNDFLQLLVAQMQYQDPLEPTSNTEYISQYATFSELEEMQNMSGAMDLTRASALVGEEVVIKSTSSETGESNFIRGKVDYVQLENGTALLSISDQLYSLDDVYSVADTEYLDAYDMAQKFTNTMELLPTAASVTLENEDTVTMLTGIYDAMSEYEKSFITTETTDLLEAYEERISELNLG